MWVSVDLLQLVIAQVACMPKNIAPQLQFTKEAKHFSTGEDAELVVISSVLHAVQKVSELVLV